MLLTVHERLMLSNVVLPAKGDFVTLDLIQTFKRELALTDAEVTEFEVEPLEGGGLRWDNSKTREKEVAVGDGIRKVVVEALTALDKAKTLTPDHMTLYRKFMLAMGAE